MLVWSTDSFHIANLVEPNHITDGMAAEEEAVNVVAVEEGDAVEDPVEAVVEAEVAVQEMSVIIIDGG